MGDARPRFRRLHEAGTFLMPNAWDAGSARLLAALGFPAVATTSSGFAASLGRMDQRVTLDELEAHAAALVEAVDIPVSVDAEHGYSGTPVGVAEAVRRIAATGAAGVSIEDYDPASGILSASDAVERIEAAAEETRRAGMVLTGRAENHLYGVSDLEDTIARLVAYADAGADILYAPGITARDDIARVVKVVDRPVNVLLQKSSPTVAELAGLGVRRISTGGALAFAAYGALMRASRELLADGTHHYLDDVLSVEDRRAFS